MHPAAFTSRKRRRKRQSCFKRLARRMNLDRSPNSGRYAMNAGWKRLLGVAIVLPSIAWGQGAVETNLYLSFNKDGPIAIGKIASLHIEQQSSAIERGTLSLDITQQLRGAPLPSRLEVRFNWVAPNSPEFLGRLKGPPPSGFDRVRPVMGMNVL